jgi:hypothetical protein
MINFKNELKKELAFRANLFWANKQFDDLDILESIKCKFDAFDIYHSPIEGKFMLVYCLEKSWADKVPNEVFGLPTKVIVLSSTDTYRKYRPGDLIKTNKLTLWQTVKYYFLDKISKW